MDSDRTGCYNFVKKAAVDITGMNEKANIIKKEITLRHVVSRLYRKRRELL